jgi:hypothetical protein
MHVFVCGGGGVVIFTGFHVTQRQVHRSQPDTIPDFKPMYSIVPTLLRYARICRESRRILT